MEIHRFEKIWLVVAMALIIGFIATVTYGAVGEGVRMVNDDGGTVDIEALQNDMSGYNPPGETWKPPGGEWVPGEEGDHYRVYVIAQQFGYQPSPIEIPADTKVTFYVTSPDVVHGFEVPGTNVNAMVIPGQVSKLTTRFPEPGNYGVLCNEYCGSAHHTMAVNMTVVPKDEFDGSEGN